MSGAQLKDHAARTAIKRDLDSTLIVEAAAGTGKTTELVARIIAMLRSGRARLESIVAVTFTEKAAGEMKLRIRTELDRAMVSADLTLDERMRLERAAHELEASRIGTIHALCADLLREHPIEAEVDPSFEVIDAHRTRRLIERVFDTWLENTLRDPPEGVRRILRRRAVEGRVKSPRVELLEATERLIDTRDFDGLYRREPIDREQLLREAKSEFENLIKLAERAQNKRDPLRNAMLELKRQLARVADDDLDALENLLPSVLRDNRIWTFGKGSGKAFGPGLLRADVLAERERVRAFATRLTATVGADLAACLHRELWPVIERYQAEKARVGALDFFDLLVFTRDLLMRCERVRRALQERISHLFVDEFQDTDPVQSEILLLLAADDPREHAPWRCRPIAGKLFVVGDPKQSIYRFRRADVTLYERVKQHLLGAGAKLLYLSTSFRSLPEIQSLTNAAFAPVMLGVVERGQAAYVPLSSHRPSRPTQPAIVALPVPKPYGKRGVTKTAIKESLPDAVGAFVKWLVAESGYVVNEGDREMPLAARHICLLFRRFRDFKDDVTLPYVRALESRRIPHVLSGGRSFHAREEVEALRAALSAIEWPDDALNVYATLRGPFMSLPDDLLYGFRERVGALSPLMKRERESLSERDREVFDMLELLGRLHRGRNRRPIAATISELLHKTRAHAALAIWPTGEQALGNVLRVLDLARSYERRGQTPSFRGFVDWFQAQADGDEASEAPVIEESSDGVRIMTVHGAKGLEFPVVILCDPTAVRRPERGSRFIDPERRVWAQALCGVEPSELLEQRERVCDQDEAENVRIAYVAVTRAREMLVVPTVGDARYEGWLDVLWPAVYPPADRARTPDGSGPGCPRFGKDTVIARPDDVDVSVADAVHPGEHKPEVGEHKVVFWDPYALELSRPPLSGLRQAELLEPSADGESAQQGADLLTQLALQRADVLVSGTRASLRLESITERAAHTEGRHALGLEVHDTGVLRDGRPSGPRFGTLVHALLAFAKDRTEIRALALNLRRELLATEDEVNAAILAVESAWDHPLLGAAREAERKGKCFREMPVTLRDADGTLLEGVVDLAYEEESGLDRHVVLLDFKTDMELKSLHTYAAQLSLYARAITRATGLEVKSALLRV